MTVRVLRGRKESRHPVTGRWTAWAAELGATSQQAVDVGLLASGGDHCRDRDPGQLGQSLDTFLSLGAHLRGAADDGDGERGAASRH